MTSPDKSRAGEAAEGKEAHPILCSECGLPMADHACPISAAPNLRQALENSRAQCEQLKSKCKETANFREKLGHLINYESLENGSDTPDFILAEYLADCLTAFDKAVTRRSKWYAQPVSEDGE